MSQIEPYTNALQRDIQDRSPASIALWGGLGAVVLVVLLLSLAVDTGLFIDNFIGGLVFGMILVMISLGLALILGLMNVVNFAHGALFMVGAYVGFQVVGAMSLPFWLALAVAPVAVGLVGIVMEVTVLRYVYDAEPIVGLLATFGLTLMVEEAVRYVWGSSPLQFRVPAVLDTSVSLGVTTVSAYRLFVVGVATVAVVGTYLLVTRTHFGLDVRAGVQDAEMTEVLGVNLPIRFTAMFFLGSALAGLGGILRGGEVGMQPDMGTSFIIIAFIVVVVGGVGSLFGSVVAGILIGLATFIVPTMLSTLAEVTGIGLIQIDGIGGLVPYLVMIAILLIRPRGLFGTEGFLE
ncbi:MAG: branched-chain amino acid ABC transporter permease [Haloarculaceae archaeon]